MSIIKLTPKNLAGIQKHFDKLKKDTEEKIRALNKKKSALERELEIFKDGAEWCEEVYKAEKYK